MLIDSHAHLNFNAYKEDLDEVIKRTLRNDIWIINIGSQYVTSKRAVEIAQNYEKGIYAAVGLHPIHLSSGIFKTKIDKEEVELQTVEEEFDYEKYRQLAQSEKVVAIGEIGLDYYYKPKTKRKLKLFKRKQEEVLLKQLNLAEELNLPVIFHCRLAHQGLLEILQSKGRGSKIKGVVHCFTGNWQQAQKYLEMGFYLGFNGIIFKLDLEGIIKRVPLDKILIETDCPYLTPPQVKGRNEPLYLKYIVERIAKIKDISYEEIAAVTSENAKKLFKI